MQTVRVTRKQKMHLPPENFASLILAARERKGWSQREAAKQVGISLRSYSDYETGNYPPPRAKWGLLVDVLGIGQVEPSRVAETRAGYTPLAHVEDEDEPPYAMVAGQRLPLPMLSIYTEAGRAVVGVIALPVQLGPPQSVPVPERVS